jgi:hypothetical protein
MTIPRVGQLAALLGVIGVGVIVGLLGCRTKPGNRGPVGFANARNFVDVPPGVESATLQPLNRNTSANARLEVIFDADDSRVKSGVPLMLDGKKVVLRDDGANGDLKARDGKFSAVIDFDFRAELTAQAEAASRALEKPPQPRPLFRGREIIGVEDVAAKQARWRRLITNRDWDKFLAERRRVDLSDFISVVDPASIDPAQSLMIIDQRVVQDPTRTLDPCDRSLGNPDGVWTFKYLVTQMVAGTGVDPADFVQQWLELWLMNQSVLSSGSSAESRVTMRNSVLTPWNKTAAGKLDLDQSPFRLSAIVNRIDLGGASIYGSGRPGELRFIFGVKKPESGCGFFPFSVIFEYSGPGETCDEVRSWAKQWVALSQLPLGGPDYNAALQAITDPITRANAAPGKANGSALIRLRTNEKALLHYPGHLRWELREFRLDAGTHLLALDTVKQTPDVSLNNTDVITQYVNENAAAIKADQHLVPDRFPGTESFLGASSLATEDPAVANADETTHFHAPGILDNEARFHFSLNTCSGCHIRETGNGFLHVDPQAMPATLSRFLTGATDSVSDSPDPFVVTDPEDSTLSHAFNDLERRRQKLAALAGQLCVSSILVPPHRAPQERPRVGPHLPLPSIADPQAARGINDPVRMTH